MTFVLNKKLKITLIVLAIPVFIVGAILTYVAVNKNDILTELLQKADKDLKGTITVDYATISPFENFPYISLDLHDFRVYETKETNQNPIIQLSDVYVGFDVLDLIRGNFIIKKIKLKNGELDIIQYEDHTFNIVKAFEPQIEIDDVAEEFHLDLKNIRLEGIHLTKINFVDSLKIDVAFDWADANFSTSDSFIDFGLDSKFTMQILKGADTTFVKNKHFQVHTDFTFDKADHKITFEPSEVILENGLFGMEGSIDLDDDLNLNIKFEGKKPNFDLLIAFAPEELIETLKRFENEGSIYFRANVNGKSANGHIPAVEAFFGCENGYFDNTITNKKLDQLGFKAYFTNGEEHLLESCEFRLTDFSARPEAGMFTGNLVVKNFVSPEIDMQIDSDFDLEFLSKFFNLNDLSALTGKVQLRMNFHDIIDLEHPERSLEQLNQAYFAALKITNLNFKSKDFHLPVENLQVHAEMDGNAVKLHNFSVKLGSSTLSLQGFLDNVPSILHQNEGIVNGEIRLNAPKINIKELTSGKNSSPIDEVLSDVKTRFVFQGPANAFAKAKGLPQGTYGLKELNVAFKNYPHRLHDFNALIEVSKNTLELKRFDGFIDDSDIHLTGIVQNYELWTNAHKFGETNIQFSAHSNTLKLKDVFSYNGTNYVPEEYRSEALYQFKIKGNAALVYADSLKKAEIYWNQLQGKFKQHPMQIAQGKGHLVFDQRTITFDQVSAQIGKSHISISGKKHWTSKATKEAKDTFYVYSSFLDLDELFSYKPISHAKTAEEAHQVSFNIFEVPFPNIKIETDIKEFVYQKYHLKNVVSSMRVYENHKVYFDKMRFDAAGGKVSISGYLNGTDPKHLYLSPEIKIQQVNLDKVMFKLDNFGQDYLISDNLHGTFTGKITGKMALHPDLTPILNESDLQIDVSVDQGRLDKFSPLQAMADFFGDKNLNRILFDKLENRLQFKNGVLHLPNMVINSSLGYIQLSGKQNVNLEMEYFVRVPLRLVTKAATQKLFGKKTEEIDPEREDDIVYKDPNKRGRYINVKISGTPSSYKISLEKNKDVKNGNGFKKDESFLFETLDESLKQVDSVG